MGVFQTFMTVFYLDFKLLKRYILGLDRQEICKDPGICTE